MQRASEKIIAETIFPFLWYNINKKGGNKMNKRILQQVGFGEEVKAVERGVCPLCKCKVYKNEFRDAISRKEFEISGLCQSCQDDIFD